MRPTIKQSILNFLNNNWTITLLSTMIGVYAGIYVNDYFAYQSLLKSKEKAFDEVMVEINNNNDLLTRYDSLMRIKYGQIQYLFGLITNENDILLPYDSLVVFKGRTHSVFSVETVNRIQNDCKITGNIDLRIDSPLTTRGLSHIIWESYKQTDYLALTRFECLTDIEIIYNLQQEVNRLNDQWIDTFIEGLFFENRNSRKHFLNIWNQLLIRQNMLLKAYKDKKEFIDNCHI